MRWAGAVARVRRGIDESSRLLVPVRCAGCGRYDESWCRSCRSDWTGRGIRCERMAGRLDLFNTSEVFPVWALVPYDGANRRAIVAAKDGGRHDLHRGFARALARLAHDQWEPVLATGRGGIAVVPAPSSNKAVRVRGAHLPGALARGVTRRTGAKYCNMLVARPRKRDQVGLGQSARSRNAANSVALGLTRPASGTNRVVLIDDIVTSGATFRACANVLRSAGFEVVAGFVLAVTRPPGLLVTAMSRESG